MAMLRFGHRHQPLASRLVFAIRIAWHAAMALSVIGVGLVVGMAISPDRADGLARWLRECGHAASAFREEALVAILCPKMRKIR